MTEFRTITPHLTVREAKAAIEFYKAAFGAIEKYIMPSPEDDKIMHAELEIGNSEIYLNDEFPNCGSQSPIALNGSPITIHLQVDDADTWFARAVSAGATVIMPLEDMFWGDRYGKLVDPFGHHWSIASHIEEVPPEEIMQRATVQLSS
ncbi:VOC family protein [Chlorogloeopsis sp. ULAP01]|uniref:VOC family protein n=1 Tax=Chlorogloeopsis sp. ULAP01 TaxID=3056483 RepID=UPI0025AAE1E3|nr:VOC family protein [Chlorogloeopsis sp. ULAP01]MDM9379194.1 VOC family protein [Chlorogloeopsis sp. ULAP01]